MRSILIALTLAAATVYGQSAAPAAAPASAPADPLKIGDVTVTGSLRARLYGWDWFQPTSGQNSYAYTGDLFRIGFSESREKWDWNAEFAVPFILGLPANPTGSGPNQGALGLGSNYLTANSGNQNTAMLFPKQLFFRLDGMAGVKDQSLKIGRFEFNDGGEMNPRNATLAALKRDRINARLVGTFAFSDVGRSFDGVDYVLANASNNFTFIASTPTRGVYQTDGWGWNRIGLGYTSYTREWGTGRHSADTRIFAIEYDDFRHILKTDNRPTAIRKADTENIRINTFGGHSVHAFETNPATFDLLFWGAVQTGRWGDQIQRSEAFDVEAGVQPKILPALRPWLRAGYTWASGDKNPNDSTHGTFFQILPTPRPFARFPFFNMMNNVDTFGILILRPTSKITTSSEFHSLHLENTNDLWYGGGGAFQPWTFGYNGRSTSGKQSLGNLYDTSAEYRLNRKLTLTAYFGYTQGLAVMEQIYPKGKDGMFGYAEVFYRF